MKSLPIKFESVSELNVDGLYCYRGKRLKNDKLFNSEKSLSDYLVSHIHEFIYDTFDDKVESFTVDKEIHPVLRLAPRKRRVDLLVRGEKFVYVIELKNAKWESENTPAIGQILDYGREFQDPKQLIIITTCFDANTAKTIQHYKLPIRYFVFLRDKILEFKGFEND